MLIRRASPPPALPGNISAATTTIAAPSAERGRFPAPTPTPGTLSPSAGGCDFAADPDQPADRAPAFWLPELLPDAFQLQAAPTDSDDPTTMSVDLTHLPGLDIRASVDGAWHGLWRLADAAHQFWMVDTPATVMASYFVVLPLDALFELRSEAVLRFWRTLAGRPVGERPHDLPPQTRDRHILILRAIDGRRDGASYRQIAETLLGFHGNKAVWEADPRKNQTRRLVADGLRYMHGGYRDLLRYPLRMPRHR